MFDLNSIINLPPFSLSKSEKSALYTEALFDLTNHHYANCLPYRKILQILEVEPSTKFPLEEMPFIPVRLFKSFELLSVGKSQVIKTMTSSGTSSQGVSKIFLDRITATNQTKVLAKIISSFTGTRRLPMLVIDTKSVLKSRTLFSARGAGVLGFSMLGYDVTYALDENMRLDLEQVESFCQKYQDENILIFGFTYMIWQYFHREIEEAGKKIPLQNGIMIHGGGWKKLNALAVDSSNFKRSLESSCGIKRIHNYYGMVEQTGSIFVECENGFLHSSNFSDILVRDADFSLRRMKETGILQLGSLLPYSYPGHLILSEDIGEIVGEDDCPCGRLGKYVRVHGRIENAEIRGCSDTFER